MSQKVLSFQPKVKPARQQKSSPPPKLHPNVQRRRLLWLGIMVCFILWSVVELIIQQHRIWYKEELLMEKHLELKKQQQRHKELQEQVKKLNDPEYLLELAHQQGYGKPGEKNIKVED